jgi:carbon-monoxide dehydrogenase iron sulfur subunit
MACSFHHSGRTSFSPSISSTKIARDNDTGHISIDLDETCDLCHGEEVPLCIKYCVYGARGLEQP